MFSQQLILFKTKKKGKMLLQYLKEYLNLEEIELDKYYKYSKYDV